jgi:hypothetical protein
MVVGGIIAYHLHGGTPVVSTEATTPETSTADGIRDVRIDDPTDSQAAFCDIAHSPTCTLPLFAGRPADEIAGAGQDTSIHCHAPGNGEMQHGCTECGRLDPSAPRAEASGGCRLIQVVCGVHT